MKNLIVVISLCISLNALAQPLEASWKTSLRTIVSNIAGEEWGVRFFGEVPQPPKAELPMPPIPQVVKKNTDISSYSKEIKPPGEYDKLPPERKRQFDFSFIEELYQVTRQTEAKDEDLSSWLNTLEQGGSREGIYQGLVLDEVYTALENMEEKPSKKLVAFTILYSQKYLNQTIKEESIQALNLYSLKRILTEKGMDLMEFYETKKLDDLYLWYAHQSAFLAKEYGPLLATQLRRNPEAEYHYQWALKMPIQHIKSEYIIKLHKVMNNLQTFQE